MKFYTKQHKFYCGIDLHARKKYVCVLSDIGEVKVHKNIEVDEGSWMRGRVYTFHKT